MSNEWYVHDEMNANVDFFNSKEEAMKIAKECIGDGGDGWPQEILDGAIRVGKILYISSETNRRENIDEDGEKINPDWDFICDCEMVENDDEYHDMKRLIEKQAKIIEKLKEANEFYANPEKWIRREKTYWVGTDPKWHGDKEQILGYEHPETDWVGTVNIGGKLARKIKKEIEEMEKNQ